MKERWKPKNLKELSEDSYEVYHILDDESDLACVLIGTSYLGELLATALKNSFIKSKVSERILHPNTGILGGFAARADIAYCIDIIDKNNYQDLLKIAEIRNQFAHKHHIVDFNNNIIQSYCEELKSCLLLFPYKKDPDLSAEDLRYRARNQFNLSVVFFGTNIHANAKSKQVNPFFQIDVNK